MVGQRDIDIILKNPIDWEKFRNKTILVTAATGRLGMYLVEAFSKADIDWNLSLNVIAMARNENKLRDVLGETLSLPNVHTLVQDITKPLVIEGALDYVFHTAGPAAPVDFTGAPVDTLWAHVMGTRNVLELARSKKSKVFYVSTVEVYGSWTDEREILESDMGSMQMESARACYPEAKRLCETMLAAYEAQYGVPYVGVRMCHTFGPGISLKDGRAFAEFMDDVLSGRDIVLHSDGSASRTYTYVADAVGAMLIAATKGVDRGTEESHFYNVANLDNLASIREIAELIASLDPNKKAKVTFDAKAAKLKYLPFHLAIMNVDKIKALGWQPQVGLRDAFKYTMESFM